MWRPQTLQRPPSAPPRAKCLWVATPTTAHQPLAPHLRGNRHSSAQVSSHGASHSTSAEGPHSCVTLLNGSVSSERLQLPAGARPTALRGPGPPGGDFLNSASTRTPSVSTRVVSYADIARVNSSTRTTKRKKEKLHDKPDPAPGSRLTLRQRTPQAVKLKEGSERGGGMCDVR